MDTTIRSNVIKSSNNCNSSGLAKSCKPKKKTQVKEIKTPGCTAETIDFLEDRSRLRRSYVNKKDAKKIHHHKRKLCGYYSEISGTGPTKGDLNENRRVRTRAEVSKKLIAEGVESNPGPKVDPGDCERQGSCIRGKLVRRLKNTQIYVCVACDEILPSSGSAGFFHPVYKGKEDADDFAVVAAEPSEKTEAEGTIETTHETNPEVDTVVPKAAAAKKEEKPNAPNSKAAPPKPEEDALKKLSALKGDKLDRDILSDFVEANFDGYELSSTSSYVRAYKGERRLVGARNVVEVKADMKICRLVADLSFDYAGLLWGIGFSLASLVLVIQVVYALSLSFKLSTFQTTIVSRLVCLLTTVIPLWSSIVLNVLPACLFGGQGCWYLVNWIGNLNDDSQITLEWIPHLVSSLYEEFALSGVNTDVLQSSLTQRAKRLAALPVPDSHSGEWLRGSVLIAEHLILTKGANEGFCMSQHHVSHFQETDWLT